MPEIIDPPWLPAPDHQSSMAPQEAREYSAQSTRQTHGGTNGYQHYPASHPPYTEYSAQSTRQTHRGTNGYQHYPASSYRTNPRKRPLSYLDRLDPENRPLRQRLETSQNTIRVLRKDVRCLTRKTRRLEQKRSSTLTDNLKPPTRYDILMLAGDPLGTLWKQLKRLVRTEFKEHEPSEKKDQPKPSDDENTEISKSPASRDQTASPSRMRSISLAPNGNNPLCRRSRTWTFSPGI